MAEKKKSEERTVLFDTRGKRRDGATMIIKAADVKAQPARFWFEIASGARQGKKYPLRGTELTIGRDKENDVVLADISVARRHARLRRRADGWLLSGLTEDVLRVNGLKIEEHELIPGDVVEIGKVELKFDGNATEEADPDADTADKAEAPLEIKRKSPVRVIAIVFAVLIVILFAIKLSIKPPPVQTHAIAISSSDKRSPKQLFDDARREVLAATQSAMDSKGAPDPKLKEHWALAQALLEQAIKLEPTNDQYKHYLEVVTGEIANQGHLELAEKALATKDLKTVVAQLSAVPPTTLLDDQLNSDKAKLAKIVADEVAEAQQDFNAHNLGGADAALEIALSGDPTNHDARDLQAQIHGRRTGDEANAEQVAAERAAAAIAARRETGPIGNARELFRTNDIDGALKMLATADPGDAAIAAKVRGQIEHANSLFKKGMAAASGGSQTEASSSLTNARLVADEVAPGSSLAQEAGRTLSHIEDKLGASALANGQIHEGYVHYAAAVAANPHDDQAQSELKRLADQAHQLFAEAYSEQESNPEAAERKYRQVVDMTSPNSTDHKHAAERLQKMLSHSK